MGQTGQTIRVRATDDFRVYQVVVGIYTASGVLVEEGNALQGRSGIEWLYMARNDNPAYKGCKVRAMAEDLPGNQTFEEKVL